MVNMNDFKFGDKLKMSNGEMGIYAGRCENDVIFLNGCIKPFTEKVHCIIIPDKIHYRVVIVGDNDPFDVVGKWEDTQPTTGEAVSDGGF